MSDATLLIQKIQALPPDRVVEVEDFVEFITARIRRENAFGRLLTIAQALEAAGAPPLTEEESRPRSMQCALPVALNGKVRLVLDTNCIFGLPIWRLALPK